MFIVEIIRYGNEDLGTQIFGVFDESEEHLEDRMRAYNIKRGGKYPAFYRTEVLVNQNEDAMKQPRVRVDL